MSSNNLNIRKFLVLPDTPFSLQDHDPEFCDTYKNKKEAKRQLKDDIRELPNLQYHLYAEGRKALLIIFQAMDAAGKDGAIRHVFSGINPQGCEVHSFKQPSTVELKHDFLWRHYNKLPERGKIGIFNRSHYENVLITRVHPELLLKEELPDIKNIDDISPEFWELRYLQINHFEKTASENGTTIIKFFLHLSKNEQKKRFLSRIKDSKKNWKFSSADIEERTYWDAYQRAYEEAIKKTSTENAPWYIIPADNKWFSHVLIGNIIVDTLKKMNICVPTLSEKEQDLLKIAQQKLLNE